MEQVYERKRIVYSRNKNEKCSRFQVVREVDDPAGFLGGGGI
jgi:hypothetical protein